MQHFYLATPLENNLGLSTFPGWYCVPAMKLYHYWRSTSSWRVRWVLAMKKISVEMIPVNLLEGEQESGAHLKRNPFGKVPVLELDDGRFLAESVAICEWLEENYPEPALLPDDSFDRAKVRERVQRVNSGIQPIQNLKVLQAVSEDPGVRNKWAARWISSGLQSLEEEIVRTAGKFSFGDTVTLADIFIVPQIYNARRFDVSLEPFPKLAQLEANLKETDGWRLSEPDRYKP